MTLRWATIAALAACLTAPTARADRILFDITDLGSLPGASGFEARDINSSGQIVGIYRGGSFFYSQGRMTRLDTGVGTAINDAGQTPNGGLVDTDINDRGQTVGVQSYPQSDGPPFIHATLTTDGTAIDIHTLTPRWSSEAQGVNNRGQVVGLLNSSDGASPFFYSDGMMIDLGLRHRAAYAVNDHGQVVGGAWSASVGAFLYDDGVVTELGSLGGTWSAAFDINLSGDIVGEASTGTEYHAFLYRDGQMNDLNDLIPPDTGWTLVGAYGINSRSEIVGRGFMSDGEQRAFVLRPRAVPEPSTLALISMGLAALACRRSRWSKPDPPTSG